MRNKRFPKYPDDTDYNTNSSSYYDDLARKQKLIQLLAEKIWEYENTLNESLEQIEKRLTDYIIENDLLMNERLENWDQRIDEMPEEMRTLFITWINDGTLEQIINHDVLGNKADKSNEKPMEPVYSRIITSTKEVDGNTLYYRIPSVIQSTTGRLVAVMDERFNSRNDLGSDMRIVAFLSDDNGKNWTERKIVLDFGRGNYNGVGDPSIIQHPITKRIFVFGLYWGDASTAINNTNPDNPAYDFVYAYSDNDGETWSSPVSIKHLKQANWNILLQSPSPGEYFEPTNTMYVPAQYWDENRVSHSTYIYSSDNGNTWEIQKDGLPSRTTEANVNISPENQIILNARNEDIQSRTIAERRGNGWTLLSQEIADPISQGCVIKGSDFYYMTHQNTTRKDGNGNRNRLVVSYSKDLVNWEVLAVLNTQISDGYSSVVDLGDELGVLREGGIIDFRVYNKKDLFSAKHNTMIERETEQLLDIRNVSSDNIYLKPTTEIVYFSGSPQSTIKKIHGYHNQEITLLNLMSEDLLIETGSMTPANIHTISNIRQSSFSIPLGKSIRLKRYKNFWHVIGYNIKEGYVDLGMAFASETTPLSEYPTGYSTTFVVHTEDMWGLGSGLIETYKSKEFTNLLSYQYFHVGLTSGNTRTYKRSVNTSGVWNNFERVGGTERGDTSNRPLPEIAGYQYFDTTLMKPIWWDGSKWVDALNEPVV